MVEINPIASFTPKKTKHPPPDTRLGIEPRKHKESKIISVQDILRTDGNRSSSPISYKKKLHKRKRRLRRTRRSKQTTTPNQVMNECKM